LKIQWKRLDAATPLLFSKNKKNKKPFKEQFKKKIPDNYARLHFGRVVVRDQDTNKIALMVQFSSFDKMKIEEKCEFTNLRTTFKDFLKTFKKIMKNESYKGGSEFMYALGWRGGCDLGKTLGRYVISSSIQKFVKTLRKWKKDLKKIT